MTAKTLTMNEVNLLTWFNGQIAVVEHQTGQKVDKLTLSVDRTVSDEITVALVLVPQTV